MAWLPRSLFTLCFYDPLVFFPFLAGLRVFILTLVPRGLYIRGGAFLKGIPILLSCPLFICFMHVYQVSRFHPKIPTQPILCQVRVPTRRRCLTRSSGWALSSLSLHPAASLHSQAETDRGLTPPRTQSSHGLIHTRTSTPLFV
jgi:hypothetical protein